MRIYDPEVEIRRIGDVLVRLGQAKFNLDTPELSLELRQELWTDLHGALRKTKKRIRKRYKAQLLRRIEKL